MDDLAFLKQKNAAGVSAYDQLGNFLLKLFLERPPVERVYREFEADAAQLSGGQHARNDDRPVTDEDATLAKFSYSLLKKFRKPAEDEEEEEPEQEASEEPDPADYPEIPDLVSLAARVRAAGISFSETSAFELQEALRRLASKDERSGDKFELLGKVGCYWVLKAETDNYPEPPEPEEEEGEEAKEWPEQEVEEEKEEVWPEEEAEEKGEGEEGEEGGEGEQEAEEKAAAEGEQVAEEEEEEEEEKPEGAEGAEGAEAEGEGEGEEEAEILSTISLDEELQPPTKVPRRVPTYRGKPFPKARIPRLPQEEHEGANRYVFFAAVDVALSEFARRAILELEEEQRQADYRRKNKLLQRPSRVVPVIRELLASPLEFVPLPEVTPEQLRAFALLPAHALRWTGDLSREVHTGLPIFDGTEAQLLRCALTTMMHECALAPRELYQKPEDEEEVDLEKVETVEQRKTRALALESEARLLHTIRFMRLYEVLLKYPQLWRKRGDDDEAEEAVEAQWAELNEDSPGYDDLKPLLGPAGWAYLLPRITGQGRVQPLSSEEYDAEDGPEPCELRVAQALRDKRREERRLAREEAKRQKEEEREKSIAEAREKLSAKRFKKWMAALEAREAEEAEEAEEPDAQDDSDDAEDPEVPEDDYDATEPLEKPEPDAEPDEWYRYFATALWRKLRVFRRPVCPWDAPMVDNCTNTLLPALFQPPAAKDRTRANLRGVLYGASGADPQNPALPTGKPRYAIDEGMPTNSLQLSGTRVPRWRFAVRPDPLNGESLVCATSSSWPGSLNIVYGDRLRRHQLVYFGDGVSQERLQNVGQLPDMCMPPVDLIEERELSRKRQRDIYEEEQYRAMLRREREEAERRAAEEGEEGEEGEN